MSAGEIDTFDSPTRDNREIAVEDLSYGKAPEIDDNASEMVVISAERGAVVVDSETARANLLRRRSKLGTTVSETVLAANTRWALSDNDSVEEAHRG